MMKTKLYLVRYLSAIDTFVLARGNPFPYHDGIDDVDVDGLALVHCATPDDQNTYNGWWEIVDIKSGLSCALGKSKKHCLEDFESREWRMSSKGLKDAILHTRTLDIYKRRCEELDAEKRLFIISGYPL